MPSWTSWLLAPPHTMVAWSTSATSSSIAPPSAHGAYTSSSVRTNVVRIGDDAHAGVGGRDPFDGGGVDVGDDDLGTIAEHELREVAADLADAGDADTPAAEVGGAPAMASRRPHALVDAERRQHAGITGPAVGHAATGDVVGLQRDHVHVLDVRADVAGRDVAPPEAAHEAPVGPQQRFGLDGRRVTDDDGLAAAVIEPGHGVLVGHRLAQGQHVGQRRRPATRRDSTACRRVRGRAPSSRWR